MEHHAPYRTTHLFSATLADSLKETANKYLRCPVWVSIGNPGDGNKEIHHDVVMITESIKKTYLTKWINASQPQMIVFCKSQITCESVYNYLSHSGVS
jgi:superfamily II DNA/RNA helicase